MSRRLAGKRVLVTGASGFLGQHLVPGLLAEGAELVLWQHRAPVRELEHARVVTGGLGDAGLRDALLAADALCHLAAFVPQDFQDSASARPCVEVNALLTLDLLQVARRKPGLRFLYFSSGQAYAPGGGRPAREEDPLFPADRAAYYLGSKVLGELFVEHHRRVHGLNSAILRVGSVYGAGMAEGAVVSRFVAAAREGKPLEVFHEGKPAADFVYVEDVARCAVEALAREASGIYNLGSGAATSLLELAQLVASVFAPGAEIHVHPARGAVPPSFAALDMTRALSTLEFRPLALRQGLECYRRALEGK